MNERQHYGFFDQFRALHWAVKLIIVVALSPFALPVLVAAASVATRVAGGFGVFLVVVAGFALAFWFAFTSPPKLGERDALSDDEREAITALPPKPAGTVRNYCESCGEAFDRGLWRCPACNARWKAPKLDEPVGAAAHYLNLITRDFESGWITRPDFLRLTTEYERRLRESRPQPQMEPEPVREPAAPPPSTEVTATKPAVPVSLPPAPVAKEPVAAITPAAEVLVTQVEPVRPRAAVPTAAAEAPAPAPGPSRPTVGEMGRAVIGWAAERQADILLYAGAFMLSIAAIIFVAYQGTALSGDLRFTILTTYAAGFLGFGLWLHRWERVKEAAPVFLGLGAILVPIDFLALRTLVLDEGQVSNAMLWFLGSSSCAALYFLLALRGYGRYYFAPAIPSALIAWGSLGAVVGLPDAWFGPWYVAIAVPAYVWSVANRDRNPLSPWITAGSLVVAVPAVAVAHGIPAMTGDDRFAAPIAYILAGLAVSAGLRWRRDIAALAALPAIGAAAMGTLVWAAFDPAPEWNVPWIAAAGLGWLIVAHFDAAGRARSWAGLAAFAGSSAVLAAHLAVATPGVDPGVLPVSYALAFIGASGAYARWRWFEAAALMPPASAMVVLTTAWAAGGANVEWYGSYAGIAPLGYLALALFDAPDRRRAWQFALAATAPIGPAISHSALAVNESAHHWSLAAAYAPVLATAVIATWRWRFLWRLAPGSLPVVAAATALAAAWAQWDLAVEWFPAFAAAAAIGYIVLAWLDVPAVAKSWATIGGIAGEIGLMGAHIAVLDPDASRWALPLAYGLVLTTASGAFAKWRFEWSPPAGFLPPLTALTSLTFAWAWWDLAPEWYGAFAAGAALGYVALAWFEASRNRRWWLAFALASGSLGVAGAHAAMALEDASRWALPVAYAIALSGAAITFARWRYTWRLAPGLVPPLTALTALTFGWAQWDLAPAWYPPFAAAAGIGFLALAWFDDKQFARLWGGWFGLAAVGAIGSAHAAVLLDDGSRWELPLTYSLALCGLMVSFARWRWVEAAAALPPVLAMTALTASWAQFDLAPSSR